MQQYWTEARLKRVYDALYFVPPLVALVVVVLTGAQHAFMIIAMLLVSTVFAAMLRGALRRRRG